MEQYLLISSISLLILYLLYRWLIQHEYNFQFNRVVGFVCLLFSTLLIWIPLNALVSPSEQTDVLNTVFLQGYELFIYKYPLVLSESLISLYLIIYLIGVIFFSIKTIIGIGILIRLYQQSEKIQKWGFTVVQVNKEISPFTFFNILFIGDEHLQSEDLRALIIHEQYHRDQLHSIDSIALEILTILFWFNPVVWLFRRDIKAQHEFMADAEVINRGYDLHDYQLLLFESRTGVSISFGSHLSKKANLKNRLKMMTRAKKQSKKNYLRVSLLVTVMILMMACNSFFGSSNNQQNSIDIEQKKNGEMMMAKILLSAGYSLESNSSDLPLYIVYDSKGNRVNEAKMLEELNWDKVQDIKVIKGEKAISEYGDEARNGVLVIQF